MQVGRYLSLESRCYILETSFWLSIWIWIFYFISNSTFNIYKIKTTNTSRWSFL
nr:MAG TPA: hypothetical protein [Caudoviricetes sp.]